MIQGLIRCVTIRFDGYASDKGLNDWIFNKELMKPLPVADLIWSANERKFREEVFATGEKE